MSSRKRCVSNFLQNWSTFVNSKLIRSALLVSSPDTGASQGLNDASDKHGFEGEGFSYLKTPLWWAGIITSAYYGPRYESSVKIANIWLSGYGRSGKFRGLCVCASHPCYASWSAKRAYRVKMPSFLRIASVLTQGKGRPWSVLSTRGSWNTWEIGLCNVPNRLGDNCPPCSTRQTH